MDKERLEELLTELVAQDWSKNVVGMHHKALLEEVANGSPDADIGGFPETDADPATEKVLTKAAQLDMHYLAVKRAIQGLVVMPADDEGTPLLLASRFDPMQMQAILKVLQDIVEWITV